MTQPTIVVKTVGSTTPARVSAKIFLDFVVAG